MRRNDKEITSLDAIETIINQSTVCRLGLVKDNIPYIVPLCFGYKENTLFFHSAVAGKKIDIINENDQVCFEFDIMENLVSGEKACDWSIHFKSVIGFGTAMLVEDPEEKRHALNVIMKKYAGRSYEFDAAPLRKTAIIKVTIDHMTGKQG